MAGAVHPLPPIHLHRLHKENFNLLLFCYVMEHATSDMLKLYHNLSRQSWYFGSSDDDVYLNNPSQT